MGWTLLKDFWIDVGDIPALCALIWTQRTGQWPKVVGMQDPLESHYFKYLDGDFSSWG